MTPRLFKLSFMSLRFNHPLIYLNYHWNFMVFLMILLITEFSSVMNGIETETKNNLRNKLSIKTHVHGTKMNFIFYFHD